MGFWLAALIAFVLLSVVVHYHTYLAPPVKGKRIPGPRALPFVGNLWDFVKERNGSFSAGVLQRFTKQFGPVFRVRGPPWSPAAVFVSTPEAVKHVLNGFQTGAEGGGVYGKGDFFRAQFSDLFGKGIFNSNGVTWRAHREFAKSLFTPDHLRSALPVFERYAERMLHQWDTLALKTIDVQDYFMRYTMSSFGEIGFGTDLRAIEKNRNLFGEAFDIVQTQTMERDRYGYAFKYFVSKEFKESMAYINDYCAQVVRTRQSESVEQLAARTDLLSKMLLAGKRQGSAMSESDLVEFIRNFMIAGRDTTAITLSFALYQLSQHPDVEARVLQEIQREVGSGPLTMANLGALEYTKRVIMETLRMFPPVPIFGYTVLKDGDLLPGDYFVPKDVFVGMSPYTIHRMEEYWPNPERFDPDRFLTSPKPFTFIPFNGGPRLCLGMDMSYLEAKAALVHLLRRYHFTLHPGFEVVLKSKVMLTAANGIRMDLSPR